MTTTLTRGACAAIAALLAAAAGSAAAAAAPSWLQPAYDAGQTFYNPHETTLKPGNVKRLVRTGYMPSAYVHTSAPTQIGGTLFTCSDKYGLGSFDAATDALLWSSAAPNGTCGGVILDDTFAYTSAWQQGAGTWINTLTAVKQSDASVQWQVFGPPDPKVNPSWLDFNLPTLWQGSLYVSHGRSLVSAYNATNGRLRWRAETGSLNNQVAVGDGLVFTTTWAEGLSPNRVYAHRTSDGSLAWSQPVNGSTYPATVAGGRVFVASNYDAYGFDAATGTQLWKVTFDGYLSTPLTATPQAVIVNSYHSTIVALDPATGATLWTTHLHGTDGVESDMVVANNVLYAATTDFASNMHLAAFDVRTGKQLYRSSESFIGYWAQIHVIDGKVYQAVDGGVSIYSLPE